MKVLILNAWSNGAIHNVTYPIINELQDVNIEYYGVFDKSFMGINLENYDIIHFPYFLNYFDFINEGLILKPKNKPIVVNIHHICHFRLNQVKDVIKIINPQKIITHDKFTVRQLGQIGITNVVYIPQVFDHTKFHHMPSPKEFTVGYLGKDPILKRFKVIDEACKLANVNCIKRGRDVKYEWENYEPFDTILNFYKNISCYIVASFDEAGPLPPQEALLCGKPVITTHVGMMENLIQNNYNGLFTDGSAKDIAKKILYMKNNYEKFYNNCKTHNLPKVKDIAPLWREVWQELV